jgi:hypothetical protein
MKNLLKGCTGILLLWNILTAQEKNSSYSVQLLPEEKLVQPWSADPTAHRISGIKSFSTELFYAGFGGVLPAVTLRMDSLLFQASVAATVYSSLTFSTEHIFALTTDYFVDGFFDTKINHQWILRLGFGHTSHHLTDDAPRKYAGITSLNYARDYVSAGAVYSLPKQSSFMYVMAYYNFRFKISPEQYKVFTIQSGGEVSLFQWSQSCQAYAGVDLKLRGELNFGSTQNLQIGIKFTGGHGQTIRIAMNYRSGLEDRGQFYSNRAEYFGAGWYIEL